MSLKNLVVSPRGSGQVTVPAGNAWSDEIDLGGLRLFATRAGADWVASGLEVQVWDEADTSWKVLAQGGAAYVLNVTANMQEPVEDLNVIAPLHKIKVRSTVDQTTDKLITLVTRPV